MDMSDCTWANVYGTDEPTLDQRGFALPLDLPPPLPPLLL